MKNPGLSLCMIVKDEADHLSTCLQSVSALVDEMIIVDTGSEDETPEIARYFGAKLFFFQWNDDFSAARNKSLRHAKGEWILVLDGDEVIDKKDHARIKTLLLDDNVDGYRLIQRTYQKQSTLTEWTPLEVDTPLACGCPGFIPSPLVRLFRNLDNVRFRGRVHELVEYDLFSLGKTILDTEIPIHHYGKLLGEDRMQRKRELYLRIGENKLWDRPFDARAFCELGIQYLELGLNKEAEDILRRACNIHPKNSKAAFNLGIALFRQRKKREALKFYRRVLELDPSHIGACNNMAQILQFDGQNKMAMDLYRKALRYNPHHHVLHYNYGLVLEKEGRWREAEEEYNKALNIEHDFPEARSRLIRLHNENGTGDTFPYLQDSKEKGWNSMEDLKSEGLLPDTEGDPISEGNACLKEERWIEALKFFVSALEHNPNDCDLRYKCGYILEKLGQKETALEQYEEVLTINPKHPETLFRLALEAENQSLFDNAITLYLELLSVYPGHPEAHFNLTRILEREGRPEEALVHMKRDLELDPSYPAAGEKHKDFQKRLSPSRPALSIQAAEKRHRIAFLWGGPSFSGDTLEKRPIGGTETAMIYMARHLSSMGHEVRVFVRQGQGEFNGVLYANLERYLEHLHQKPADMVIASRFFHPFIVSVPALTRIFWTEDAHDQPFVKPLSEPEILTGIDRIFTVSKWQTRMLSLNFRIPEEKFYTTRNGVFWDNFENSPRERNRKRLIYTSTPFRGLDVLLDLFPEIRHRVPDARLDIYSSMAVYQIDQVQDEAIYGNLYRKAKQPGVTLKKSVIQTELAKALLESGILAYPNHFAETSCIAAMEALAAGVPVVTSYLGALPETVAEGGILIQGDPRSPLYQAQFIEAVCELMCDSEKWEGLSEAGRLHIYRHNRWDLIAGEWVEELNRLTVGKI